jgi:transcriptional regulator with XRE-family HTH domain
VSSPEDLVEQIRKELHEDLVAEPIEAALGDEQLVSRAAQYFDPGDLNPMTIDLILGTADSPALAEGHEERSRTRVEQAVSEIRKRPLLRVGETLHEARRHAGVSEVDAASVLGISRAVLKRIELGGVALLLGCAPEQVATYVVSLDLDAKVVLAALYSSLRPTPDHPRSVYGYAATIEPAPASSAQGRETSMLEDRTRETDWAVTFLLRAEYEREHQ